MERELSVAAASTAEPTTVSKSFANCIADPESDADPDAHSDPYAHSAGWLRSATRHGRGRRLPP